MDNASDHGSEDSQFKTNIKMCWKLRLTIFKKTDMYHSNEHLLKIKAAYDRKFDKWENKRQLLTNEKLKIYRKDKLQYTTWFSTGSVYMVMIM